MLETLRNDSEYLVVTMPARRRGRPEASGCRASSPVEIVIPDSTQEELTSLGK